MSGLETREQLPGGHPETGGMHGDKWRVLLEADGGRVADTALLVAFSSVASWSASLARQIIIPSVAIWGGILDYKMDVGDRGVIAPRSSVMRGPRG